MVKKFRNFIHTHCFCATPQDDLIEYLTVPEQHNISTCHLHLQDDKFTFSTVTAGNKQKALQPET